MGRSYSAMVQKWTLVVKAVSLLLLLTQFDVVIGLRMRGEPYVGLSSQLKRPDASLVPSKYNAESRVIGGQDVAEGAAPWVVSIENAYYYHFCGGAIINEKYILTAANCVAGLQARSIRILTGTTDWWNMTNPEYFVKRIILHCNFDKPLYHNDIALLELTSAIEYNDVTAPVALAELDELEEGEKLTFMGWGSTEVGEQYPLNLRKLEGTYLPYDKCRAAHYDSSDVDLGHVCMKQSAGQGTCHGDSGGPLINAKGELVGISNWGVPCGQGFPDCYARVPFYLDWIRTNIKGCRN